MPFLPRDIIEDAHLLALYERYDKARHARMVESATVLEARGSNPLGARPAYPP